MQITQATDYALRGMIYLAAQDDREDRISAQEIANEQVIPIRFLLKIMRQLLQSGLLKSYRGNTGGYVLARPPQEITLLDIVTAVEGPVYLNRCLSDPQLCNRQATAFCLVHDKLLKLQNDIIKNMQSCTLLDFIQQEKGA